MENSSGQKMSCPICGQDSISFCARKNGCDLFRCAMCGLIFIHPLPADTSHLYNDDYFAGAVRGFGYVDYDKDKAAMEKQFLQYLADIEMLVGQPGRMLDVGAATGYFLELAKNRGWRPLGVEISAYAAGLAVGKGLDVRTGSLAVLANFNDRFEAVTMWDVLEHLPDPKTDLSIVHTLSAPGGLLVINTPNAASFLARCLGRRWHLLVPPEHLFYFTPKAVTKLLDEAGFEIINISYPGKKFTLEYIVHTLARWQGFNLWKWLLKFLEKRPRLAQFGLPINLRDNMLVIAKKNDG